MYTIILLAFTFLNSLALGGGGGGGSSNSTLPVNYPKVISSQADQQHPSSPVNYTTTLNNDGSNPKYPNITLEDKIIPNNCAYGVRARRELRNLPQDQVIIYLNALLSLQQGPIPTPYDRLVKVHLDIGSETHVYPMFFPWHRAYIYLMELKLQKIDSNIMIPFWDWNYDSQAPELSVVWENEFFGGNGVGTGKCVQDGKFKDWKPQYPTPHCFSRDWQSGKVEGIIEAFQPIEVMNALLNRASSYDLLRTGFENPMHNAVHNSIGGEMPTMHSPNEYSFISREIINFLFSPLFWSHHSFVDKVWAKWQDLHPKIWNDYGGTNLDGSKASLEDDMFSFRGTKVKDVMNITALCYKYEELTIPQGHNNVVYLGSDTDMLPQHTSRGFENSFDYASLTPADKQDLALTHMIIASTDARNGSVPELHAGDRKHLLGLRIPQPIPEEYFKTMNVNLSDLRDSELLYAQIVKDVNNIPGYVSPCSLWMREDFVEKLIQKNKERKHEYNAFPPQKIVNMTLYQQQSEIAPRTLVLEMKDVVRDIHGGPLRNSETQTKLENVVGPLTMPQNSVIYPYTVPFKGVLDKQNYY